MNGSGMATRDRVAVGALMLIALGIKFLPLIAGVFFGGLIGGTLTDGPLATLGGGVVGLVAGGVVYRLWWWPSRRN